MAGALGATTLPFGDVQFAVPGIMGGATYTLVWFGHCLDPNRPQTRWDLTFSMPRKGALEIVIRRLET